MIFKTRNSTYEYDAEGKRLRRTEGDGEYFINGEWRYADPVFHPAGAAVVVGEQAHFLIAERVMSTSRVTEIVEP